MMQLANFFEAPDEQGNNPLMLKRAEWFIDGDAVTATAAQLNATAIGVELTPRVVTSDYTIQPADNNILFISEPSSQVINFTLLPGSQYPFPFSFGIKQGSADNSKYCVLRRGGSNTINDLLSWPFTFQQGAIFSLVANNNTADFSSFGYSEIGQVVEQFNNVPGTINLDASAARIQSFSGTGSGTCVLPDARTLPLFKPYEFRNIATGSITVQTNPAVITLVTVPPGGRVSLRLTNNTTQAGGWEFDTQVTSNLTAGSIVFAGSNGFLSQDNANLFYNASTAQLGIGINSIGVNNQMQLTNAGTFAHTLAISGTISAVDSSNHQHYLNITGTFTPAAGSDQSIAIANQAGFQIPTGQATNIGACYLASPVYPISGTITKAMGYYYDGGAAISGAGSIVTQYGGYYKQPLAGTTKIALYADNITIGNDSIAPPANGLLVAGSIQNTALTASSAVYTDASKNLISANISGTPKVIGSSTYTLLATDNFKTLFFTAPSCVVTFPNQGTSALLPGFNVKLVNMGLGDLTYAHQAGDIIDGTYLIGQGNSANVLLWQTVSTQNYWAVDGGTKFVQYDLPTINTTQVITTSSLFNVIREAPFNLILTNLVVDGTSGNLTININNNGNGITTVRNSSNFVFSTVGYRKIPLITNTIVRNGSFVQITFPSVTLSPTQLQLTLQCYREA